jgi:hypothetical protein
VLTCHIKKDVRVSSCPSSASAGVQDGLISMDGDDTYVHGEVRGGGSKACNSSAPMERASARASGKISKNRKKK